VKTLLFDAYAPGDEALESSHWIAERTHERLGDQSIVLGNPDALRTKFERLIATTELSGVAFFGHGDGGISWTARLRPNPREPRTSSNTSEQGAVYGCDGEAALDQHNAYLLKHRFCHVLACNVGFALGPAVMNGGASCFVAYETSITPEFDVADLPEPLIRLLADVATMTTQNLHDGVFEGRALKRMLHTAIETLEAWFDGDEGIAWTDGQMRFLSIAGIRAFARQLERDMVVHSSR
jgi:hypothetical protein